MKGADPAKNTKNTREKIRGNTREHTRETLNQQEIVTHMLDPQVHKRSHDPRTTKDDTKVAGLLREEVSMIFSARRS